MKFLILIYALLFCPLTINGTNKTVNPQTIIKIRALKPFQKQVTAESTTYVIKTKIDLKGECVTIPDNSTLLFKRRGMLKNGTIIGNYSIDAPSQKIFDNVNLSAFKGVFKFIWLVGERKELYNADFKMIPNCVIDFGGLSYTVKEPIVMDELSGFSFENLDLKSDYSIRYWTSASVKGECRPAGNNTGYIKGIQAGKDISNEYIGCIIEITTADQTKFDSRPDSNGVPTLYKGLTSIIENVEGKYIVLKDSLEHFSGDRNYGGQNIKSTYVIYNPRSFKLKNCHFVFTSKVGLSLNGSDFLIEGCSFEALNGSNALLSLGGYLGLIRNCSFKGAYYPGTGTSYGIQVNKGTHIVIENCEFYENRRGVDFSGVFESRYNEVKYCSFYQEKNLGKTGSAIGGHSTSFGNVYRNNKIYGDYQIGIHCRGENELIDGNLFECFAIWMIGYGYNTTITNNKVVPISNFTTGVFAGSDIEAEGNTLFICNNDIDVRAILIVGSKKMKYDILDNLIHFSPNTSSLNPVIFNESPEWYELRGNTISCSRSDVKLRLIDGVDLPKRDVVKGKK